jgi:hypothetical protein
MRDHGHSYLGSEGKILVHCLPSKPTATSECHVDTYRKLRTHTTHKLFNKGNAFSVASDMTMSTHTCAMLRPSQNLEGTCCPILSACQACFTLKHNDCEDISRGRHYLNTKSRPLPFCSSPML